MPSLLVAPENEVSVAFNAGQELDPFIGAPTEVNVVNTVSLAAQEIPAKERYVKGEPTDFNMGGYHVHTQLGQGGMAVVFLARPPGGHHDVVLKRIRPSLLAEEKYVKLFRREARIASGLLHANIVRFLDHAEEKGEAFIVMEYLDGTDLRDLAERNWHVGRWLPIEAILRAVSDSARGLHHAHTKKSQNGESEALVQRTRKSFCELQRSSGRTRRNP
ncbi:MAG: protein kinase [Deltaproteobacteria bacterium]|nr:protein kinase [Deltaproteobacteria bacterium]